MVDELDCGWQVVEGRKPIIVVAGHNFRQGREGRMKPADMGTGRMAREICEKYGFWGIVSTRDQLDPNWYVDSPFRKKVKQMIVNLGIKLVIDIHGSKLGSEELLELKGNKRFRKKYGIEVEDFRQNNQTTLAEEMEEVVAALQIEIREDGRIETIDKLKFCEAEKLINNLLNKLDEN